jgi:hypothetical protein
VIAPEFLALFPEVERPRRRACLAAYVQEGTIAKAKKKLRGGCNQSRWLRDDPVYRAAFERAKRIVAEAAERDVCRRARSVPLSDRRMKWMLRSMRPERYAGKSNSSK